MSELRVLILGPRGVGKSSILAAMYDQFEKVVGRVDLQLNAFEPGASILQDRLANLHSLFDGKFKVGKGLLGDDKPIQFQFGLGKKGKKSAIEIVFEDFPGGYVSSSSTEQEKKYVKDLIEQCGAVVIVVDAPYLMEEEGKWHQMRNRPMQITEWFKEAYIEDAVSNVPRLVLFVPVKVERYVRNGSMDILLERLNKGYESLFNLFKLDGIKENVSVVVTPVQTVGGVEFQEFKEQPDKQLPVPVFFRTQPGSEYDPKDSEQPLRYLLGFLLKAYLNERGQGFFGFFREIFKVDSKFKQALEEFATKCKKGDGFKMIQNHNML